MPQPNTLPIAREAPLLLRLHADDDVVMVLRPLEPGEALKPDISVPFVKRGGIL